MQSVPEGSAILRRPAVKFTAARITRPPDHALTRKDVKRLLEIIPDDWRSQVSEVVLRADAPRRLWDSDAGTFRVGAPNAEVRDGRLRITCRGSSKEEAVRAALYALAAALGHLGPQKLFTDMLTAIDRRKLEELVRPYLLAFGDAVSIDEADEST
jgi:hypothetical protein